MKQNNTFTNNHACIIKAFAREERSSLSAVLGNLRAIFVAANKGIAGQLDTRIKAAKDADKQAGQQSRTTKDLQHVKNCAARLQPSAEVRAAVDAAVNAGLNFDNLSLAYIQKHLAGTAYCPDGQAVYRKRITKDKAVTWVQVTRWSESFVMDLLKRANREHCKALGM